MSKDLKHTIYNSTECLSEKMLFDYIDNKLSQKERHIVEKHLLDCEMCSDALEGLELVKDRNRIALIKEAIAKRVAESSKKEAIVVSFNYKLVFSVAATIALLVVGVFYFNTIGLKESAKGDMAELKQNESPATTADAPPPPPAPMDEEATSVSQTVSGAGSTISTKNQKLEATPQKVADEEIALAEGQAKEVGYNKSVDGDMQNKPLPDVGSANGAIVVSDEIIAADDRKANNIETVSIPKAVVTEREKDAKLDAVKKSEEPSTTVTTGGTYAWKTPNPVEEKNQKNTTKTAGDQTGEQKELSKKTDKAGKYRAESASKGKDKISAGKQENKTNEDETVAGNVAYEPKSVSQDTDATKTETKTTNTTTSTNSTNNNVSTNSTPVFESTIAADSTEQVYTVVEQMPQYPGGDVELMKAATKQLTYPAQDDASNSIGTIIIEFIVDSSGKATHPRLVKPKNATLEKQVNEFVNKMPKWKPGKQNNKNVSVKLVLPIKINVK